MIKGIVAKSANNVIGYEGHMPWGYLPADMKHFRSLTKGHIVVMGRPTFESLPHPLEGRLNIVLSRELPKSDEYWVLPHIEDVLHWYEGYEMLCARRQEEALDLWIIGGEWTYRSFAEHVEEWYITTIGGVFKGDAYFINPMDYGEWEHTALGVDTAGEYALIFHKLTKKHPETVEK